MAVNEVFADGVSGVRVVGDTVRLDFVSLAGGETAVFDPRVRVVLPVSSLAGLLDILGEAQRVARHGRAAAVGRTG